MPTLDQLSGEKRAILELVLRRGQSYEDIGEVLDMPVEHVRDHARESLAALAPRTARRVDNQWRGQVADYLLGQQSGPEVKATRAHLKASEPARAWALSTLDSLGDLYADGREPFIPAGGRTRPDRPGRRRLRRAPAEPPTTGAVAEPAATPEGDGATEELDRSEAPVEADERPPEGEVDAREAPTATRELPAALAPLQVEEDERAAAADEWRRFKRRGVFAAIVGAVVLLAIPLLVILLLLGGEEEPATETVPTTATETTPTAGTPSAAQVALEPVGNVGGEGVARIVSQGEQGAVSLRARLPPTGRGEAYVVWLANSPEDSVPVAAQETDRNGNFGGNAQLPRDHQNYRYLDILAQDIRDRTEYSGRPLLRGDLDAAEEVELQDGANLPQTAPAPRPGGGGRAEGGNRSEGGGDRGNRSRGGGSPGGSGGNR